MNRFIGTFELIVWSIFGVSTVLGKGVAKLLQLLFEVRHIFGFRTFRHTELDDRFTEADQFRGSSPNRSQIILGQRFVLKLMQDSMKVIVLLDAKLLLRDCGS
jgi:hypothetical protein